MNSFIPKCHRARSGAALFFTFVFCAVTYSGSVNSQAPTPVVTTDTDEYVAGDMVTILGRDFVPGETVHVQVTHADGTPAAGSEPQPSTLAVAADGTFQATWSINITDLPANGFAVAVIGDWSGGVASAPFVRVGAIAPNKGDYQPGETAILAGRGFLPGEVVKLQVAHINGAVDGNGHDPFYVIANGDGAFTATWYVDPDDSRGSKFLATATGEASGVVGTTTFWDAGPISLTALGTPYSQNFDTLATSGTSNAWADNSTVPGWFSQFTTTSNPATYVADAGTSTTGGLHSYGTGTSTERALGSIGSNAIAASGSAAIVNAAKFVNDTGGTITSLAISYVGEQWRNGGNTTAQKLDFQYQVANAGTVTDANTPATGWTDVDALDFAGPVTGVIPGALDGNAAANRVSLSQSLSVTVAAGQEIWLRWVDTNDSGNDHALAIDDFSVTPSGFIDNAPAVLSTLPGNGATDTPLAQNITVTFSEAVNVSGSWFSLVCGTSGAHTAAVSGGPTAFTLDPDNNFVNSETCTLTVNAAQVTDQDSQDPPDTMAADYVTSFTTFGPDNAPTVTSTLPADGATNVPLNQNLIVTFSEPVNVTDPWFSLSCTVSGTHTAAVTGGPTSFTLNPGTDFVFGEECTLVIDATRINDQDGNDPPDNMVVNFTAGFATEPDPCTLSFTPVYQIQGSGPAAAITGVVTTRGVVVGDYEGPSPAQRGFFLQDVTGDGDTATSDGIFVFNGNNNSVSLGDVVRVTGTASDFQDQTQISATTIIKCGSGSVSPVDVTFPVASSTFLERYEGMLVRLPQTMYVTEHFQLGRFGQVVLSSNGRLQQPTSVTTPGAAALALQAQNSLNRIILDDAKQDQNPDPILFARGGSPLSASNTLRGGDTATATIGVMTYTWAGNAASGNAFRVRPVNALNGFVNFEATNPRPASPPDVGGTVRVIGMNLLNFFNTFTGCKVGVSDTAIDCRGAESVVEFDRQWPKTVAAITTMNPDILGVNELENDGYGPASALQFLVDKLNEATAPGTYAFIDADANTEQTNAMGTDAVRIAMLYKPAAVTPVGQTAVLNSDAFVTGGDGFPRNRPSLAQAFQVNATGAVFIVDVNHLKSKGSACDAPDAGDGQGNCNQVRTNAATALMNWLASDPTGTGDPDVLMLGDYNSYAQEDPITVIRNAGFTNLIESFLGADAYSYVFDGQWGYLDHALGSASMVAQVAGVADHHINADEPSVLDYNTNFKSAGQIVSLYAADQFRVSDHDPVVVGLNPNAPPTVDAGGPYSVNEGSSVTLAATGSDANGDSLAYAWDLDNNGSYETAGQNVTFSAAALDGPSSATVGVKATDPGGLFATATVSVTINNVAPTVSALLVTAEPSIKDAAVTASATFSDPASDAPFTCTVDYGDGSGPLAGVVASNSCTGPSHTYASVGSFTVSIVVTDKDGGAGANSSTHAVIFAFTGFFRPIDNLPSLNRVNAGQAIAVKFSLDGNQGSSIFASGYPKSEVITCGSSALVDGTESTVPSGGSGLAFDPATGQYQYVWKTDKAWAGTCRQLVVTLSDGITHRANFDFVK